MAYSRNGFQHQLMKKGMKNLGVKFLFRIKFLLLGVCLDYLNLKLNQ